jgi:hypothetical protein
VANEITLPPGMRDSPGLQQIRMAKRLLDQGAETRKRYNATTVRAVLEIGRAAAELPAMPPAEDLPKRLEEVRAAQGTSSRVALRMAQLQTSLASRLASSPGGAALKEARMILDEFQTMISAFLEDLSMDKFYVCAEQLNDITSKLLADRKAGTK